MPRKPAPLSVSTPLAPSPYAPWLGGVGILMLLIAFAQHNAWFGFVSETWPWDVFVDAGESLLDKVLFGLWLATGLWCAALGFTGARRTRALGCVVLAGAIFSQALRADAGLELIVFMVLAVATLGAGLLVAREPATRVRGRLLAATGGLLVLWMLALPWDGGVSNLEDALCALGRLFGDDAPETVNVFQSFLPTTLLALVAVGGVLAGLGLAGRRLLAIWFFILLGAWLLEVGTRVVHAIQDVSSAGVGADIVAALFVSNLLLGLLALFIVRDLANMGGGEV